MRLQYLTDSMGKTTGVFIPIKDWDKIKEYFKEVDDGVYREPTKEEIINNIRQGLREVQMIEKGKMEATTLNDFLNEL